jgi:hypothetical protein
LRKTDASELHERLFSLTDQIAEVLAPYLLTPRLSGPHVALLNSEAEEASILPSGYLLRLPHLANPNDLFSHISLSAGFTKQPKNKSS